MALRSLGANKMRSILTMLGIIIGTGAVIALVSIGQGAQNAITDQVKGIGSNLVFIYAGQVEQSGSVTTVTRIEPLTTKDAEALADPRRAPHVLAVAPDIERTATLTFESKSFSVPIVGTLPAYQTVRNADVGYGRFFTDGEESSASRVVVVGHQTATDLFDAPEAALGQTIRINGVPFEIIGVLAEKGDSSVMEGAVDRRVIVPLSTAQRRLYSSRAVPGRGLQVDIIYVSAVDEESIDAAIDEMRWILRDQHDIQYEEDDFTITSQKEILDVYNQIISVFSIFLVAIASISLLVGGIGIMNIMLVSVTERTREIGIRKAVGAKRSAILWQFLVESVVLSIFGGVFGILLGWAITLVVNSLGSFKAQITIQSIVLSVSFSLIVGLFFGIYPASRAANLRPIEALRYE
jgi:putative ABC transport system permease protein